MALAAATALAPALIGAFHRPPKQPDISGIISRYRSSRPAGYVTPEDEAAAERTRTRIAGAAAAAGTRARQMNARQVTARNLGGPAAAALDQQANDTVAQGAEDAARNSSDQLYNAFQSNLGYARGQNDTAFGAELGSAQQTQALNNAKDTTFWNSMLEAIPAVTSGLGLGTQGDVQTGTSLPGGNYTGNAGGGAGGSYGPSAYGPYH